MLREIPHHLRTISMPTKPALTVLVVDDEALLRWSIAEVLSRGGHSVIQATSVDEARAAMNRTSERIDVVLLDDRLPDSNDLRFLEEVRRRLPHSAVVLMTAYSTPDMVHDAMDNGAYCVLGKPFDMHDIEALLSEAHRASRYH